MVERSRNGGLHPFVKCVNRLNGARNMDSGSGSFHEMIPWLFHSGDNVQPLNSLIKTDPPL